MLNPMMERLNVVMSAAGRLAGCPLGVTVTDQPTVGRNTSHRFFQDCPTDTFQHQRNTASVGQGFYLVLKICFRVVDGYVGSQRPAQLQLVCGWTQ